MTNVSAVFDNINITGLRQPNLSLRMIITNSLLILVKLWKHHKNKLLR